MPIYDFPTNPKHRRSLIGAVAVPGYRCYSPLMRRTAAQARHALVNRLPARVRERLVAHVVPPFNRFTVPLDEDLQMSFAAPGAHRYANRLFWEGAASYEPVTVKTWWALCRDAVSII